MLPPQPQHEAIDSGEAWAAILGIKPVLVKVIEEVSDKEKADFADLATKIAKAAKSLCAGSTKGHSGFKFVNLEKMSKQILTDPFDDAAMERVIRPLPSDDQLPYLTVARATVIALQKALPVSSYQTFSGTHSLAPGFAARVKFSNLVAAFEDPVVWVFSSLASGNVDADIVQLLKGTFKTLMQAIEDAIREEVTTRVMKNERYTLPPKAELGMALWMGQPPQPPVVAPPAPPAKDQPAAGGGPDKETSSIETPGQEIEAG